MGEEGRVGRERERGGKESNGEGSDGRRRRGEGEGRDGKARVGGHLGQVSVW